MLRNCITYSWDFQALFHSRWENLMKIIHVPRNCIFSMKISNGFHSLNMQMEKKSHEEFMCQGIAYSSWDFFQTVSLFEFADWKKKSHKEEEFTCVDWGIAIFFSSRLAKWFQQPYNLQTNGSLSRSWRRRIRVSSGKIAFEINHMKFLIRFEITKFVVPWKRMECTKVYGLLFQWFQDLLF